MIPHPTVAALLAEHGTTTVGRTRARAALRRVIVARAEMEAQQAGRTVNCRNGHHAPDGCRSDGSNCICNCHDPKETP